MILYGYLDQRMYEDNYACRLGFLLENGEVVSKIAFGGTFNQMWYKPHGPFFIDYLDAKEQNHYDCKEGNRYILRFPIVNVEYLLNRLIYSPVSRYYTDENRHEYDQELRACEMSRGRAG